MGNLQQGKEVYRSEKPVIIEDLAIPYSAEFLSDPAAFVKTRVDFRERLEEWGYMWAAPILEECLHRPAVELDKDAL